MRIKQCHISKSLEGLDNLYLEKFNLAPYSDISAPLVIIGMYRDEDYEVLANHEGHVSVVWTGSDSLNIERLDILKKASHFATGIYCSKDLAAAGLDHIIEHITPTKDDLQAIPRGDKIYIYSSDDCPDFYGERMLPEIKERTGLEIIRATFNTHTRAQLLELYKDCFIGLRLTPHDGLPNTVIELGLLGRRSIYNGDIVNSIPWVNVDDICENIMNEYATRHEDNTSISDQMKQFIKINNKFLQA